MEKTQHSAQYGVHGACTIHELTSPYSCSSRLKRSLNPLHFFEFPVIPTSTLIFFSQIHLLSPRNYFVPVMLLFSSLSPSLIVSFHSPFPFFLPCLHNYLKITFQVVVWITGGEHCKSRDTETDKLLIGYGEKSQKSILGCSETKLYQYLF